MNSRTPAGRVAGLSSVALVGSLAAARGGCTQVYTRLHGPRGRARADSVGATQEQVLIVLGTPSTVATLSGEVFYYISQRGEQISFLPQKEIDRRVIAVYFDKGRRVQRLANYGLKDGRIFDYISRTMPTGGVEQNYARPRVPHVQVEADSDIAAQPLVAICNGGPGRRRSREPKSAAVREAFRRVRRVGAHPTTT